MAGGGELGRPPAATSTGAGGDGLQREEPRCLQEEDKPVGEGKGKKIRPAGGAKKRMTCGATNYRCASQITITNRVKSTPFHPFESLKRTRIGPSRTRVGPSSHPILRRLCSAYSFNIFRLASSKKVDSTIDRDVQALYILAEKKTSSFYFRK